jgi:DNA-binding NarL/FixJ family response regulator
MASMRIFVADDHEVVRRGIIELLAAHPGWEVCGEAGDGREAIEKVARLRPELVVLDIGMPNMNGLEATRQIMRNNPLQKVIILTVTDAVNVVRAVLEAGARGFVLKDDAARDLVLAIEALQNDRNFFTARVAKMILEGYLKSGTQKQSEQPTLTAREREIVQLLAEGKGSKEVASILDLSVKTVETHRANLMRKMGFHSVSELVIYAIRNHIVQVNVGDPGAAKSGKGAA